LIFLLAILALWSVASVHADTAGQTGTSTAVTATAQETDTTDVMKYEDDDFEDEEYTDAPLVSVSDPIRPFNLVMHHFNDTAYYAVIRPVASAYRALVPTFLRNWTRNFFNNITGPRRFINCLLQGKNERAEEEFIRFCTNTTIGILGLGDPASNAGHPPPPKEDLGQTMAAYGAGEGFYLVLPILGPYTLRDAVGWVGNGFLHPFSYIDPVEWTVALWTYENTNKISYRLGDYEAIKEAAIEPYEAFRDAYLQHRRKQVQE
jgi:phospholipid-binding lipoprotein MlaA